RADLHDDVLLVERVARDELQAKPRDELVDARRCGGELLAREIAEIAVVGLDELPHLLHLALGGAEPPHRIDDLLEARELLPHLADAVGIGRRGGIGHEPGELVVALFDPRETAAQARREEIGHAVASSSDATATSIIPASGRRVVMRWSRMPGATRIATSGLPSCAAASRNAS